MDPEAPPQARVDPGGTEVPVPLFVKRRRWLEWIVIALVVGWIGVIAWNHHLKDRRAASQAPESAMEAR